MIAIAYYRFGVNSPKSNDSLTAPAFSHCGLKPIVVGFMMFQFLLMSQGLKKTILSEFLGKNLS